MATPAMPPVVAALAAEAPEAAPALQAAYAELVQERCVAAARRRPHDTNP